MIIENNIMTGLNYILAENKKKYDETSSFSETMNNNNLPNIPDMWGWGDYHETSKSVFDLGIATAKKTLNCTNIDPDEIDAFMFCSKNFSEKSADYTEEIKKLIEELGIYNAFPFGTTLNNCATFLSGITLTDGLVKGGQYKNILVITCDKVFEERDRFKRFALFSDGAASCIVTSNRISGYEIINSSCASDYKTMSADGEVVPKLLAEVNEKLFLGFDYSISDVKKIFCNNIFIPMVRVKECQAGFSADQLFLENVEKKGHCYSSDSLINLTDYACRNSVRTGDLFILSADSPGLRYAILLRGLEVNS